MNFLWSFFDLLPSGPIFDFFFFCILFPLVWAGTLSVNISRSRVAKTKSAAFNSLFPLLYSPLSSFLLSPLRPFFPSYSLLAQSIAQSMFTRMEMLLKLLKVVHSEVSTFLLREGNWKQNKFLTILTFPGSFSQSKCLNLGSKLWAGLKANTKLNPVAMNA